MRTHTTTTARKQMARAAKNILADGPYSGPFERVTHQVLVGLDEYMGRGVHPRATINALRDLADMIERGDNVTYSGD
mgnify:CR=1 FL=1|jgi:hypothetical protein